MRLDGRTVLITGASEGIGAECAHAFRKRGAKLSLVARSKEKLEAVGGNDAVITAGDLTDPAVQRECVERTIAAYGRIDVLVNNAGVGLYVPSWQARDPEVRAVLELNLFVPIAMTRLAAPHMVAQHSGMIVNIGSIAGKVTLPWMTIYSATKYALGSLTEGLRLELKDSGVKTMIVCPGYVKTGFQSNMLGGEIPLSIQRSKKFAITPAQCAADIVAGVEKEKRTVVTPKVGWLLVGIGRLFPSLVDSRLHRMYRSAENS